MSISGHDTRKNKQGALSFQPGFIESIEGISSYKICIPTVLLLDALFVYFLQCSLLEPPTGPRQ